MTEERKGNWIYFILHYELKMWESIKFKKTTTKIKPGHMPDFWWSQTEEHSCDTVLANQFCHSSQEAVRQEDEEFIERSLEEEKHIAFFGRGYIWWLS